MTRTGSAEHGVLHEHVAAARDERRVAVAVDVESGDHPTVSDGAPFATVTTTSTTSECM